MGRNCLEGYLTEECAKCKYWCDGAPGRGIGCGAPFPIDHCDAFAKVFREDTLNRLNQE